jgi:hypothetical protein
MSDFSLVWPSSEGDLAEEAGLKVADRPETVSDDRLSESKNASFEAVQARVGASTLRGMFPCSYLQTKLEATQQKGLYQ